MRTYNLTLGLDIRAVVPQQFTDELREQAKSDDATAFLKKAHAEFPEDDEQFTLFILKNGLRKNVRGFISEFFTEAGIGGTLSPIALQVIDRSPPVGVEPALATDVAQAIQG